MELSSLQEGLQSIGDGTFELPNPGRETKLQDNNYHWVSLCMQHKWRQQCMDTTIHLYEGPTIQDRPESSETVITDLIAFINQKWSQNHEIILNLDANEALGEESQGIAKLMRECNLVDLHRRGDKRRINFMLGTPWIQTCIQR